MRRLLVFTLLAYFTHPSPVHSQSASLTGVVVDPAGAVVPGTTITVLSEFGELKSHVVSGSDGQFSMSGLEPGKYTVIAKYPGMRGFRKEGLKLNPGRKSKLEITLGVSSMPNRLKKTSMPFEMIVERTAKSDFERELIAKAEHAPCPGNVWSKQDGDEPFWPACLNYEALNYYEDLIRRYGEGVFPESGSKLDTGHVYYYAAVAKDRASKGWLVRMNFLYSDTCGNLCGQGFEIERLVHFDDQMKIVKIEGDGESVFGWIS